MTGEASKLAAHAAMRDGRFSGLFEYICFGGMICRVVGFAGCNVCKSNAAIISASESIARDFPR